MRRIRLVILFGLAAAVCGTTVARADGTARSRSGMLPGSNASAAGPGVATAPGPLFVRAPGTPVRDAPPSDDATADDDGGGGADAPAALTAAPWTLAADTLGIGRLRAGAPTIVERDFESNPLCRGRPQGAEVSRIRPSDLLLPLPLPPGARTSPTLRARRPADRSERLGSLRSPADAGADSHHLESPALLVRPHPRP